MLAGADFGAGLW
ncbi:MAG: hypothetical protein M3Y09_20805, partial [Actinomycetota bacterium]|nr:hypothetical protein [Actinomycetota bacterium]